MGDGGRAVVGCTVVPGVGVCGVRFVLRVPEGARILVGWQACRHIEAFLGLHATKHNHLTSATSVQTHPWIVSMGGVRAGGSCAGLQQAKHPYAV